MKKLKPKLPIVKVHLSRHKGLTAILAITFTSFSFFSYFLNSFRKSLKVPTSVVDTEKSKSYIYWNDDNSLLSLLYERSQTTNFLHDLKGFVKEILPNPFPTVKKWKSKKNANVSSLYLSPWSVLQETYSKSKSDRLRAVARIAAYKDWHDERKPKLKKAKLLKLKEHLSLDEMKSFDLDSELRTLAQAIDPVTAIGLARTRNADLRLFLPPPALPPLNDEADIEDELRELLIKLPQTEVEKCVSYFTSGALNMSNEQKRKRGGLWCFGGNGIRYTREITPQQDVELMCLHALSRHSVFKDHCQVMVDNGILQLLQRIQSLRPNVHQIQENIFRIVSNICVYKRFHHKIYQSGWISILAEMSRSEDHGLRIQASRGLANLDLETVKDKLCDGIYVLFPQFRTRLIPDVDIVFVHGLMGGAFYSWRSNPKSLDKSEQTQSWPESWLPLDISHSRVLCVSYDTSITEWMAMCPHDDETKSISYRSRQLLDNLIKAGVGKRPIVWVCHSMGGLIVKQILMDAGENKEEYGDVRNKTKAIVFFSTPHKGSELASYSLTARKLVYPSIEVMELSHDSPRLATLNKDLKKMVDENNLHVLSFGEVHKIKLARTLFGFNIVSPNSANPDVGRFILTNDDHLTVCKPSSRDSETYQTLLSFIKASTNQIEEPVPDHNEPELLYFL